MVVGPAPPTMSMSGTTGVGDEPLSEDLDTHHAGQHQPVVEVDDDGLVWDERDRLSNPPGARRSTVGRATERAGPRVEGGRCKQLIKYKGHQVAPVALDEVSAYVAERVAPYKRIRRIEAVDGIPRSAMGKVLRGALGPEAEAKAGAARVLGSRAAEPLRRRRSGHVR
jgi:acyl-CoA synthetase (AMP-forming)/AMP-acid ligase II